MPAIAGGPISQTPDFRSLHPDDWPTLASLIDDRYYPREFPSILNLPAVTYEIAGIDHSERYLRGLGRAPDARFIFQVVATTYLECQQVADKIHHLMIGYRGMMGARKVIHVGLNGTQDREGTLEIDGAEHYLYTREIDLTLKYREPYRPEIVLDLGTTSGAIETSLYAYLSSFADVWPVQAMGGSTPYIVYRRTNTKIDQDLMDRVDADQTTWRWSVVGNYLEAMALADQIRMGIEGATGKLHNTKFMTVSCRSMEDDSEYREEGSEQQIFTWNMEMEILARPE